MVKRKIWTNEEREVLKQYFPHEKTAKTAERLGRTASSVNCEAQKLALKKSEVYCITLKLEAAAMLVVVGVKSRFKAGIIPGNKGKKIANDVYEKCKRTMFKKGHVPHNAIASGAIRKRKDRLGNYYYFYKAADSIRLVYYHRWLWEQVHGEIEKGMNVVFRDGNPMNCVVENLECISRSELMKRNTMRRFPTEVQEAITALATLNKRIKNGTK